MVSSTLKRDAGRGDAPIGPGDPTGFPGQSCLNCGTPLTDAYCARCGQQAHDPRRLVLGLVQDVIVDTISVDSKLARTLAKLFLRPASLARAYLDGRRVRYTAPFRLYLFSSLVFFIFLWTVVPFDEIGGAMGGGEDGIEAVAMLPPAEAPQPPAEVDTEETPAPEPPPPTVKIDEDPPLDCQLEGDEPQTLNERLCVGTSILIGELRDASDRVEEDPTLFFVQVRNNIPRVMLLAPVIYAITMGLLYIYRRRILIYDHLVVSLYMHAALYAYLSASMLVGRVPIIGDLAWLIVAWGIAQAFLVHRRAYGSGWFSSIIKFSLTSFVYYIAIVVLLALGLGVALYQS